MDKKSRYKSRELLSSTTSDSSDEERPLELRERRVKRSNSSISRSISVNSSDSNSNANSESDDEFKKEEPTNDPLLESMLESIECLLNQDIEKDFQSFVRFVYNGVNIMRPHKVYIDEEKNPNECRDFYEVYPHLNHLKIPPVPFVWHCHTDYDAFRLIIDMEKWDEDIANFSKLSQRGIIKHIHNLEPDIVSSLQGKFTRKLKKGAKFSRPKLNRLLLNRPLGPECLYSSSNIKNCLRDGKICLANVKQNSILLRDLSIIDQDETESYFQYKVDNDSETELVNYDIDLKEYIYGFDVIPEPLIFAIRHRKNVSLIDKTGDILQTWQSNHDINDLVTLPSLDKMIEMNSTGTLILRDIQELSLINTWTNAYNKEMKNYNWTSLLSCNDDNSLRIATRKSVTIFDIRTGNRNENKLLIPNNTKPSFEIICGITDSKKNSHQFYGATTEALYLIDQRQKGILQSWNHCLSGTVMGCEGIMIDDTEYVSIYDSSSNVSILAADWSHKLCSQRLSSKPDLNCQTSIEKRFPVTRGHMGRINGLENVLNTTPFQSDYHVSAVTLPWTGLTMLSKNSDDLSIFFVNGVGMIFHSQINHIEDESQPVEDRDVYTWLKSSDKDLDSIMQKFDWLNYFDVEFDKKEFVDFKPTRYYTYDLRKVFKNKYGKIKNNRKRTIDKTKSKNTFKKKDLEKNDDLLNLDDIEVALSDIGSNDSATNETEKDTKMETDETSNNQPGPSKKDESVRPKSTKNRQGAVWENGLLKPNYFPAIPWLKPIDFDKDLDEQGKRVVQIIYNGKVDENAEYDYNSLYKKNYLVPINKNSNESRPTTPVSNRRSSRPTTPVSNRRSSRPTTPVSNVSMRSETPGASMFDTSGVDPFSQASTNMVLDSIDPSPLNADNDFDEFQPGFTSTQQDYDDFSQPLIASQQTDSQNVSVMKSSKKPKKKRLNTGF